MLSTARSLSEYTIETKQNFSSLLLIQTTLTERRQNKTECMPNYKSLEGYWKHNLNIMSPFADTVNFYIIRSPCNAHNSLILLQVFEASQRQQNTAQLSQHNINGVGKNPCITRIITHNTPEKQNSQNWGCENRYEVHNSSVTPSEYMKMSKHSIIYHKHPTFLILISPATHIYIKQVHECMCGLWYRHACHMADDLNQMKTLSIYQAHQTCFPFISPPSYR